MRQGRVLLGRRRREALVQAHAGLARSAIAAQTVKPKAAQAIVVARTQLGLPYGITGCRCSPQPCRRRDCSGEIYFAINTLCGTDLCGSSFSLAQIGRDHDTIIPKAEALVTAGAIGVRNPWGSPNAIGSNGHTWWCEGDGVHSIEEGGRRTGCYRGLADKSGPGGVIYLLWPGFDNSTYRQELTVIIQTHHYNLDTGAPVGPPLEPIDGNDPTIAPAADGSCLEARWGASIANDVPANDLTHLRRWIPKGGLSGATIVGCVERVPDHADPHPGGVALLSDGRTRRFRLS